MLLDLLADAKKDDLGNFAVEATALGWEGPRCCCAPGLEECLVGKDVLGGIGAPFGDRGVREPAVDRFVALRHMCDKVSASPK